MNKTNIFIIVLLILLSAVSVIFYLHYNRYKKQVSEWVERNKQYEQTLLRLSEWEKKSAADDLFFSGEYEKAIDQYGQITLSGVAVAKLIEDRNRWVAERDSLRETLLHLMSELDQTQSDKDSFFKELKERNNLLADYNRRIDSLEQVFEELQSQLRVERLPEQTREEKEASKEAFTENTTLAAPMDTLIFRSSRNVRVFYFGQVSEGMANGQGTGLWSEGGYYFGNWLNNRRHGKGFFLWPEGDRYEGDYQNDQRHGQGTYFWANGDYYKGSWENNKRHGMGSLFNYKEELIFSGLWYRDEVAK